MSRLGVAVVIPCLDLGHTLVEALESVRQQTSPAKEVIVVDDGSRDGFTRHLLAGLSGEGITVLTTDHAGPAEARNVGIRHSRSALVLPLDADDILEPTYLERAARLLERRADLSFVSCALQMFGDAFFRWDPPIHSVAEVAVRGAHISTVFRRELWERVGGFDSQLPAFEPNDFWLSALELGFKGVILEQALVAYRDRRGSRYHRSLRPETYLAAKSMILDRHADTVAAHGEGIFLSGLDLQSEVRAHGRHLREASVSLEGEVPALQAEIDQVEEALESAGGTGLAWGDLLDTNGSLGGARGPSVYAHYTREFLHANEVLHNRRTAIVRQGESGPEVADGSLDTIAVVGALSAEPDPGQALERFRKLLRPGGTLLATFPGAPTTPGFLRGFTEASVRALLADLFPPGAIEVTTYGNLFSLLASACDVPAERLAPDDLERVDPDYPVLLAARATVPEKRRLLRAGPQRQEGVAERARATRTAADHGIVLMYHRVADLPPDSAGICVDPKAFEAHMSIVAESCTPLSLSELVTRSYEQTLPPRPVAVTFDDGYLDNLQVASPVLSRLGIPATFFVNSVGLGAPAEAWWDSLERIVLVEPEVPERLELTVAGTPLDIPTVTEEDRRRAFAELRRLALSASTDAREALVAALGEWHGVEAAPRSTHRLLTSEEVSQLAQRPGHEIGAHTTNHLMLTRQPVEVRRREVSENRALLEEITGAPVAAFSYPYGDCDLPTVELVDELRFETAVTVDPGAVNVDSDPLRLPRVDVAKDEPETFAFRLRQWLGSA